MTHAPELAEIREGLEGIRDREAERAPMRRFSHWFAGFTDGEGSFIIGRTKNPVGTRYCTTRFIIALRADDAAILHEAQRRLGVGKVRLIATEPNPQAQWQVSRKDECLVLVRLFDRYPLRAKKARDFEIWRKAVLALHTDVRDWDYLERLKVELEAQRVYGAGPVPVAEPSTAPALFEVDPC